MMIDQLDYEIWERIVQVPLVSKPVAVVQGIVNLVFPGFGTMIAACANEQDTVSKAQISIGLFQFLSSFLIIGWVWAMYWSYLIGMKAFSPEIS